MLNYVKYLTDASINECENEYYKYLIVKYKLNDKTYEHTTFNNYNEIKKYVNELNDEDFVYGIHINNTKYIRVFKSCDELNKYINGNTIPKYDIKYNSEYDILNKTSINHETENIINNPSNIKEIEINNRKNRCIHEGNTGFVLEWVIYLMSI